MKIWRSILALVDPDGHAPVNRNTDRVDPQPALQWAIPLTIPDCATLTDGLYAFDVEVREAAFGDGRGSLEARALANQIAELVGAAYVRGYHLVPVDVEWLMPLERMLDRMLSHTRTRRLASTRAYANLLRSARVYAGMAPIRGWALNQRYGTEWFNGQPEAPTTVAVKPVGDLPHP